MKNVTFIELENPEGATTEHAIIDRGNNEYTSMPKSVYDEMIAAQSTPNEL
jgi:predicted aspartyl protease